MSPGISIREGIRWLPKPFSEPTRTVVLTSPENRFVDVRILSRDTTDEDAGDENFEGRQFARLLLYTHTFHSMYIRREHILNESRRYPTPLPRRLGIRWPLRLGREPGYGRD